MDDLLTLVNGPEQADDGNSKLGLLELFPYQFVLASG